MLHIHTVKVARQLTSGRGDLQVGANRQCQYCQDQQQPHYFRVGALLELLLEELLLLEVTGAEELELEPELVERDGLELVEPPR